MPVKIKKTILRDDVRKWVMDAICRGQLAPGSSLAEVELARHLGISRTPLREALVALEQDGFVESRPQRGFVVAPLLASALAELYPLIGNLEAFVLRTSPLHTAPQIESLRRLNGRVGSASSVAKALAQDEKWHAALLAGTTNRTALTVIDRLKAQVRRYEFAYTRIIHNAKSSMLEHEEVMQRLEDGDLDGAARRLEEHWQD